MARSHSRPHVPDDNPYSEAQIKTLKYFPDFPARFGSIHDARGRSAAGSLTTTTTSTDTPPWDCTPRPLHFGAAGEIRTQRAVALEAAYRTHPERFAKLPVPPKLPLAAWINPPTPEVLIKTKR